MEKDKQNHFDLLSNDVLSIIFHWAVFAASNKRDECPQCGRVFYFALASPTAESIRLVCSRWQTVFLFRLVLARESAVTLWCYTPSMCVTRFLKHVHNRMAHTRKIFHIVDFIFDPEEGGDVRSWSDVSESESDDDQRLPRLGEDWGEELEYSFDAVE